ncbi:hypothetical protein [Streptomyces sp. 4F14]|uniref:hypothetical protein n=1 Tax=Streptomyces sp. 4F14 TaxID=3394380 RepID=UPI003A89D467
MPLRGTDRAADPYAGAGPALTRSAPHTPPHAAPDSRLARRPATAPDAGRTKRSGLIAAPPREQVPRPAHTP